MNRQDIIGIAEGIKLIEEGVKKIQNVMRGTSVKSLKEVAEQLLPVLGEDDAVRKSILKRLE